MSAQQIGKWVALGKKSFFIVLKRPIISLVTSFSYIYKIRQRFLKCCA